MVSSNVVPLTTELESNLIKTNMWQPDCPVSCDRLSLVKIRYVDFDGNEHEDGEMVALDVACEFISGAFESLFALRFPVQKVRSVHHYGGSDLDSMAENNTSCFCHRPIEGTTMTSLHSYGLAVDVNPKQNPFVQFDEEKGTAEILPPQGWEFLNRRNRKPGMVEDLIELWAEYGFFVWGGSWTTPIDYHHFQTPRGMAELLLVMNQTDGKRFFELCISLREKLKTMPNGDRLKPLIELYRDKPSEFFATFENRIESL